MKRRIGILLLLCGLLAGLAGCGSQQDATTGQEDGTFRILISDDNADLSTVVEQYTAARGNEVRIETTYDTIAGIKRTLEKGDAPYDAVWVSSSVYLQMQDGGQKVSHSKFTAISPVVFAVTESKAQQLGFEKDLRVSDIINAVEQGKLSFLIPNVTQTNSGLSAYLGILSALCGNPVVLTEDLLDDPTLQERMETLFSGVQRSSGSDAFIADLVLSDTSYECIVAAEHTIIALNQRLEEAGREPMRLLYPQDGVTIADMPLAYLDHGNEQKLALFQAFQDYVLGAEGQNLLARLGRRTSLGGLISAEYSDVFRQDWGIDPDAYLHSIVYPSKGFIQQAMTLYQEALRKPAFTVFCLDYSGSMYGKGHEQLSGAMHYILDPAQAGRDYLQFTDRDIVVLLPFDSDIREPLVGHGGQGGDLLAQLDELEPDGGTDIYLVLQYAMELQKQVDLGGEYTLSIVLMTDGESMYGLDDEVREAYESGEASVAVYSIMFGDANPSQLEDVASWSSGKVFDGRTDLIDAFREVRGYN